MNIYRLVVLGVLIAFLVAAGETSVQVYTIAASKNPSYGVYCAENGEVYVVLQGSGQLMALKGNETALTVNLPSYSGAVPFRITAGGGYLYVVYQKGPLLQLNLNGQVVKNYTIPHVGKYPAITYANGYVVVTASYGNAVYFIGNGEVKKVDVVPGPQALAYDNYTNVVYVGAYQSNVIEGISLSSFRVVENFTINDTTVDAMAFVPPDVLAIATYEQQVEFVNLTTHKVIGVQTFVQGGINGYSWMAYDPADDYVILSLAHNGDQVVFMNSTGAIKYEVTVGGSPNGIVYDPANKYVYVMDYATNGISYFLSPGVTEAVVKPSNPLLTYVIIAVVVVVVVVAIALVLMRRK